ncbi:hypothetical protein B5D77_17295 [Microcystis sp. MC19]|nr:hypothetical protein B5D77_17295 [Microcystis sp. MC19]
MKSKSARHWGDRGGNLGTFSLKMGKTLHPTPCAHEKLFQQTRFNLLPMIAVLSDLFLVPSLPTIF